MLNKLQKSTTLALTLLLTACVTINIYFPSAEAEEAAGRIVDDILDKTEPPEGDKGGSLDRGDSGIGGRLLDFMIPAAHAAQPDFTINTPKIRKLRASMKKRHKSLAAYYANGSIGFSQDASVSIRSATTIPLKERNKVKKLVSAENSDRKALYKAIADANGHPEWEPQVRATFARTWVEKASSGWWYQSNGAWRQK